MSIRALCRVIGLLAACGLLACNAGNFTGGAGKKSGGKSDSAGKDDAADGPTDEDDVDNDAGGPDGEAEGSDGQSSGGEDASDSDFGAGSLDEEGLLVDECIEEVALPEETEAPVEMFNWIASGATSTYNQVMATPVVGMLSGKTPTIIASAFPQSCVYTADARLYAIDGKNGDQLWVSATPSHPSASAAIGNIDGEKGNEVVFFGADGKVHALKADGSELWTSSVLGYNGGGANFNLGGPILVDLDGDGDVEVVGETQVFEGKTGKSKFALASVSTNIVADTDGEPGLEIVTTSGIVKADGSDLCKFPLAPLHYQAARKVSKDDETALIVGGNLANAIGYDGKTCKQRFSTPFPGGGGGAYNMGDLDGDQELDFVSAGRTKVAAFDGRGNPMWDMPSKDPSSYMTGSTMFDFNGDRKTEVIYNDEDYLRVYDGKSGKVLYEIKNSSGTLTEYPVVADVDGDGHANIVVHANDCFAYTNRSAKGIRVFKEKNNKWVGTRKIWNQYAYDPMLVKESGTLTGVDPAKIYKPWLKSPHLAGFRNNIPRPAVKDSCKPKKSN